MKSNLLTSTYSKGPHQFLAMNVERLDMETIQSNKQIQGKTNN
jgi:hypothetical protein